MTSPARAIWNGIGLAALTLATATLAPRPAAAQAGRDEGVGVVGKGLVRARPTVVEIDLDVSAAAELTGDAIVKFRDAAKRVRDAFDALKLPDVVVEERGPAVEQKGLNANQYMIFDPGTPTKARTEVQLSRKLVVKARGIEAMEEEAVLQLVGRLIDVAQDAGAKVGPPINPNMGYRYGGAATGLARFVVEDVAKLKREAYAAAAADARARAELLAALSDATLGPVLSAREGPAPSANVIYVDSSAAAADDAEDGRERVSSPRFQEIPIKVELLIRYAIEPKGEVRP